MEALLMFGIDDAIGAGLKLAGTVIERVIPDKTAQDAAKAELLKMQLTGEIAAQADELGLLKAQIDVDKTEAGSSSVWVAGWRPAVGWAGAVGFAVQFALVPLVGYGYSMFGHTAPAPMQLDPLLMDVLFGILGLNIGARTYEKTKGVAS